MILIYKSRFSVDRKCACLTLTLTLTNSACFALIRITTSEAYTTQNKYYIFKCKFLTIHLTYTINKILHIHMVRNWQVVQKQSSVYVWHMHDLLMSLMIKLNLCRNNRKKVKPEQKRTGEDKGSCVTERRFQEIKQQ